MEDIKLGLNQLFLTYNAELLKDRPLSWPWQLEVKDIKSSPMNTPIYSSAHGYTKYWWPDHSIMKMRSKSYDLKDSMTVWKMEDG